MKNATRTKKTLFCLLGALVCLFLTWLIFGLPALSPGWAFWRARRAAFLPVSEVQTVLKAKEIPSINSRSMQFWLTEEDHTVYVTAITHLGGLVWEAQNPPGEVAVTDGPLIVPLPVPVWQVESPHVAVRADGESAKLAITLDDGVTRDLISCGRQDGWFLFRYDTALSDAVSSAIVPDSPEARYLNFLHMHGNMEALHPTTARYHYTLHFTSYDSAGNVLQEASLEW